MRKIHNIQHTYISYYIIIQHESIDFISVTITALFIFIIPLTSFLLFLMNLKKKNKLSEPDNGVI